MKKLFLIVCICAVAAVAAFLLRPKVQPVITGAPPYIAEGGDPWEGLEKIPDIVNWKRPNGPLRVGLQVGHLHSDQLPDELERIRGNTGASSGTITEVEVNLAIAEETAELLKAEGIEVDILPATIPPNYWADVFIAIHADGHEDPTKSGFKVASPRRDYTGKAERLVSTLREEYGKTTGLVWDEETITRNMRGYYAFSWWRFDHAIHPMTPAAILETGFLTTPSEASFLVNNPEIPAQAIADSLMRFLKS